MASPTNSFYSAATSKDVLGGTGSAPVAEFIGSPTSGATPLAVTFTDQSTGTFTARRWDFGDGSISTSANPTHVYSTAGTCTVTLTLTWSGGIVTRTRSGYVSATSGTPDATAFTLSLSASSGTNGVPITVTVTPNGPIPTGGASVTLAASNSGALGTTSMSFTSGSTAAQSTTLTRVAAGTSVVTMTNNIGLLNNGSGASFSSADPVAPPVPGATLASLTLLTSGAGNFPWTVGHAFKPGDVPVPALAGLQVDPKNYWPDGSVKMALVSGVTTAAGVSTGVALGTGDWASGTPLSATDIRNSGMAVSFGTDAYGSATWAANSADWEAPFVDGWARGPVCYSAVYRKVIGSDTHLVAWMEVRYYSTGEIEVHPWIENGFLYRASPGPKIGTYTFSIDGVSRFDSSAFAASLNVGHHTRQPLIYGSGLSYWRGTSKHVVPKHEAAYLASTGLVSAYQPDLLSGELNALPSIDAGVSIEFTPWADGSLDNSNFPTVMGGGGSHKSIGIQPAWEALALTRSTARAWEQMIRESYRFGRYPTHFRDENTNRPLRFSQHPQASVDNATIHGIKDAHGGGSAPVPTPSGSAPHESAKWAPSHQPASPLLAYITSGRYFFMEECQFIATANFMQAAPAYRGNSAGTFNSRHVGGYSMELRKVAWCLRNLFIASCLTPDDDPLKSDFDASVQANVDLYHGAYVASPSNPYGMVETGDRSFTSGTASGMVAGGAQAFQYDFFNVAWGRGLAFRIGATRAVRKKHSDFYAWVAQSIVGRLGTTAATDWLYRDLSAVYNPEDFATPRIGWLWPGKDISTTHDFVGGGDTTTGTYPDYAGGTGPWWDSWGQMYAHMIVGQAALTKAEGDLRGGYLSDSNGNFWNAFPAITQAVSLGVAGAAAGWTRVKGNGAWSYLRSLEVNRYATNSVEAVTLPLENFTNVIPAVGGITNASLNDAYAMDFEKATGLEPGNIQRRWWLGFGGGGGGNVFQDAVQAYSGTTWAPEYGSAGAWLLNGGSDGASLAQITYVFDFDAMGWKCVGAPASLPDGFAWANYYWNGTVYEQRPFNGDPRIPPSTEARDPVFYDYEWGGSKVKLANHSYLHNAYVPESSGGGKNGSIYLPCSSYSHDRGDADPRNGKVDTFTPHLMNLHTGKGRRAVAAPVANAGSSDGFSGFSQTNSVRDTTRNKIWHFLNGGSNAYVVDLNSGPPYTSSLHVVQKTAGGNFGWISVANSAWIYVPEADCMVGFAPAGSNSIPPEVPGATLYTYLLSMATGVPVGLHDDSAALVPTRSMPRGGVLIGATWVPASALPSGVGKFYLYEGFDHRMDIGGGVLKAFAYTLTPSSLDFATASWSWGREWFDGPLPVFKQAPIAGDGQRQAVQGKWQYVPALSCIASHDGPNTSGVCVDGVTRNGIVQLWRPPGTPI